MSGVGVSRCWLQEMLLLRPSVSLCPECPRKCLKAAIRVSLVRTAERAAARQPGPCEQHSLQRRPRETGRASPELKIIHPYPAPRCQATAPVCSGPVTPYQHVGAVQSSTGEKQQCSINCNQALGINSNQNCRIVKN